jgi:hypothetical protein
VREKVKISDNANSGCYCFKSGEELKKECEKLIKSATTQKSQDGVGEFYTSGVIAQMMAAGSVFKGLQMDGAKMHVLGTPSQLEEHVLAKMPMSVQMRHKVGYAEYDKVEGFWVATSVIPEMPSLMDGVPGCGCVGRQSELGRGGIADYNNS